MLDIRTAFALFGLVAMAGPAFAQNAPAEPPEPPKRPPIAAPAQSAAVAAPAQLAAPAPAPAAPTGGDVPPPPEFVSGGQPLEVDVHPVNPRAISPADKATLDQIDKYFNSIRVMSGKFVQIGADGQRITGSFWVSKPGRMRFDYDPPSPLQLLADGTSVAVRNRKLNTQDLYLISQTPLRFLLADSIDLIQDSRVIALGREQAGVSVVLEEKSSIGGSARIQLSFPAPSFTLRQWTITDAQGYDTTVTITSLDTTSRPPDRIFYIDQTRILK
ncbi:LolA family protein [Labrys monachus]|uniref:Outer membrane lipoprotein-sorting protein n=1 Tax=Labrys monachus TaxID=217067 RepID=A0ABU0FCU1_9HYPH|nr:outer-membrane lipoprotein carrier protein LolA [Labrys monachus]MDQ0392420.1 outer membrane lipoprotein-sorting protein [Labrys monachus]